MTINIAMLCITTIFLIAIIAGIITGLKQKQTKKHTQNIYPYQINKKFLSYAETEFFHILEQATEKKAVILTKVNLEGVWKLMSSI